MSTPLEREIEAQRRRLLAVENNGASEIVRSYKAVTRDLRANLDAMTARIEEARAAGEEVGPSWLVREERYAALVAQNERLTLDFLRQALGAIEGTKRAAVAQAVTDAPEAALAAAGAAPAGGTELIAASFSTLPREQLARLVTTAGDGGPLGSLLAEIAPGSIQGVKDALLGGVARGAGVRQIARDVRTASGMAQNHALLVARSEVLRAYRETSLESFRRSQVVKGWVWMAEATACPICNAEHGSEHTLDEVLASHPACRCTMVPKTLSWKELGFDAPDRRPEIEPGAERFAGLSEGDKLAVLGRSRLDAYNAGKISLEDMVRTTQSERWGPGKRLATLKELSLV